MPFLLPDFLFHITLQNQNKQKTIPATERNGKFAPKTFRDNKRKKRRKHTNASKRPKALQQHGKATWDESTRLSDT